MMFNKAGLCKLTKPHLSSQLFSLQSRNVSEFTYLPKTSSIPSFAFEASLPRLPIPEVKTTAERYSLAVEPLFQTQEERKTIKNLIQDFQSSPKIAELQQKLIQNSPKDSSFISKPWFDLYLASRLPLPLNFNPFCSFTDDPRPEANKQTVRAANFIYSIVRFRNSLRDQRLAPEIYFTKPQAKSMETLVNVLPRSVKWYAAYLYGAYPLDMSQYQRLFSSTRLPRPSVDVLSPIQQTNHIAVLHRGKFWKLDVADSSGEPYSRSEILKALNDIIQCSAQEQKKEGDLSVAVMTSAERNEWADVRKQLESSQTNRASFEQLDSALFVLSLDADHPNTLPDLYRSFLIGDGENRWFDKSFSVIITKEGKAAINFEHSWGDGVAIVRLLRELYDDTTKLSAETPASSYSSVPPPTQLKWEVSDPLKKRFQDAKQNFDKMSKSINFNFYLEQGFGKDHIKKYNLSPDGVMQMCFQIAYGLQHQGKRIAPTYESCSTAAFKHGRTETIRPVSHESVKMVSDFLSSTTDASTRFNSLREAINVHSQRVRDAATGKGYDRHLFALKTLAAQEGTKIPLFEDPSYSWYHHNILSTSTLTAKGLEYGGFGPVVDDGYGVAYAVESDRLGANVSSYGNHSAEFIEAFKKSVSLVRETLQTVPAELYQKK